VPYPHATADHQARNAEVFARAGAARVLADASLTPERLRAELDAALEPATLAALRAGARGRAGGDPRANIVARVNALLRPNYVRP
jgi:UDP-N-acetylglucosamine--N-acetylmuramyl-(pentapeptide) pyrophosphoryl-undecaprenol N-acetylglucosamine transferase